MRQILNDQDREFIRVLEDLIDVLLDQGVITLDMFPDKAAEKFVERRMRRGESAIRVRKRIDIRRKPELPH
ncbi:MAG: hypothetical protein R3360_02175 [Alphaproteobacteria bacterium]|nr:hypothetical protein [Alphaproteobacteria bacterium]